MAITINVTGEHRQDQTSGLQIGKDNVALSTTLVELPDPFENFLKNSLGVPIPATLLNNAADYEATSSGATFIQATSGAPIEDLFFSDSTGELFNGDIATYNGVELHVAGSTARIYLYSFDNGNILIGTTEDPSGVNINNPATLDGTQLVFAYYLQENTTTHSTAAVWGVTFQPLEHPIATNADDFINMGDFLHVTAEANLTLEFDTLKSGKFLWVALGDGDVGMLVSGRDLNVNNAGVRVSGGSDPSDSVITSQGGTGATTGINNQMYTAGDTAVFTFVTGFAPLAASTTGEAAGDNVNQIDYNGYLNSDGASIFISQTQGKGKVNLTIRTFEAGGVNQLPEEGNNYIGVTGGNNGTSGAFADDLAIPVGRVQVFNGTTLVGTWGVGGVSSGTTVAGVKITILGNAIDVEGITTGYTVHWDVIDGETFNRFQVTADANTQKFDLGRVVVDEPMMATQNIGNNVVIYDDGPTINSSSNPLVQLDDDSLPGGNAGGIGDDPLANTTGTLNHNFGTDGGVVQLLLTGAPAGYSYSSGPNGSLLISQGGVTVITITLNSATGQYTAQQNSNIEHPAGMDENNVEFTVNYRVIDADGDIVDGNFHINVDDDTPELVSNASVTIHVDEDDLSTFGGDLSNGISDQDANEDEATFQANALSTLVSPGADRPAIFSLNGGIDGAPVFTSTGNAVFSQGVQVKYAVLNATTVIGYADSNNDGVRNTGELEIFRLTDNGNGSFTFNLKDQLDHSVASGDNGIITLNLSPAFKVADQDGDSVILPNVIRVEVENDVPSAGVSEQVSVPTFILDETRPVGTDTSGGVAPSGRATLAFNFANNFFSPPPIGADGPGNVTYSLVLAANNIGSGLFALDPLDKTNGDFDGIGQGAQILMNQSGNTITGSLGGVTYFTIAIDPATALITFTQIANIWHPTSGSTIGSMDDTAILMTNAATDLLVRQTITDYDGDISSASIAIGQQIFRIQDDGPDAAVNASTPLPTLVLDESPVGTDPGGDFDPAGRATVAFDFTDNFVAADFGSDGHGAVTYSLSLVDGVSSGLSTSLGEAITLNQSGNTVTGSASGVAYLTISIDPVSGELTFNQLNNVQHPDPESDDESVTLTTTAADDLQVIQTVTDADGDRDSAAIAVGQGVFQIEDSGPIILPFYPPNFTTEVLLNDNLTLDPYTIFNS